MEKLVVDGKEINAFRCVNCKRAYKTESILDDRGFCILCCEHAAFGKKVAG